MLLVLPGNFYLTHFAMLLKYHYYRYLCFKAKTLCFFKDSAGLKLQKSLPSKKRSHHRFLQVFVLGDFCANCYISACSLINISSLTLRGNVSLRVVEWIRSMFTRDLVLLQKKVKPHHFWGYKYLFWHKHAQMLVSWWVTDVFLC